MTATQLKAPLVENERADEVIDADIKAAEAEAKALIVELQQPITTPEEKVFIEEALSKLAAKGKFLDDERKISVTPLNNEVDRINAWYRPATSAIKTLIEQGKQALGAYVLKQRKEAERLAAEAATAAAAALAAKVSTAPAVALMTQSGAASQSVQSQKGAAVTHKPVWKWRIVDAASVPRAFLSPDENKIKEHVAKNGNVNVPAGVEVYEDVAFRISKK